MLYQKKLLFGFIPYWVKLSIVEARVRVETLESLDAFLCVEWNNWKDEECECDGHIYPFGFRDANK